ncbi:hypothetical protein K9M48_03915 [Candidatus Gracilibacteria bacterium]|nr:hypothetical protein [Candidatus Gracilibacteria bacterium]
MSAKLWFLQDLEEIIQDNRSKFGTSKNSWYNALFSCLHAFIASKYAQREEILKEMMDIYDQDNPPEDKHLGFYLPSSKPKEGTLEFGLFKAENVEKMRPIRARNNRINEEILILINFLAFLQSIDPKSEILEEQYFLDLESIFDDWWTEQVKLQTQKAKESKADSTPQNSKKKK